MQLFCFTYAGGTAAFYNDIEKICKGIIFVKLEYPGHGTRRKEALCEEFRELARDLLEQIKTSYSGGEYCLMGYSMGSIALFETLQLILEENILPVPKHIFLAAHAPMKMTIIEQLSEQELSAYVKKRTIEFGGIPKALQGNKPFWRTYLPLYETDYMMISKYDFDELAFTTDVAVTIFYSDSDTPKADMEKWKKYFRGEFEMIEYSGTHFFIYEHLEEMAEIVMKYATKDVE